MIIDQYLNEDLKGERHKPLCVRACQTERITRVKIWTQTAHGGLTLHVGVTAREFVLLDRGGQQEREIGEKVRELKDWVRYPWDYC